jgi:hypothetical protein
MTITKTKRLITALFVAIATVGVTAGTASAAEISPYGLCSGSNYVYKTVVTSGPTFTQATQPNSSVTGGPGVTLSISTSTNFTVTGTVSTSATATAGVILAQASVTAGVSLAVSKSGTTTNSGAWTVPSNYQVGRLAIGSYKYSGTVTQYLENSSCTLIQQGSPLSFNVPRNEWSFMPSRLQ